MTQRNTVRLGRGVWVLAALALLLPWPAASLEQGYDPQDKEDLHRTGQVAAGAAGAINPVAGAVVGKVFEIGEFVVFFGMDPEQPEVFKIINKRLDVLDKRMAAVEEAVANAQNEIYRNANLARVRELRRHQSDLRKLLFRLANQPTVKERKELANDAQLIAEEFLMDTGPTAKDLWLWSDLALVDFVWKEPGFEEFVVERGAPRVVKAGQLFPPDFKAWPAMEVYTLALSTWMAAMQYAGDGNAAWVKETYGRELQKHADFLSVRSVWNPLEDNPRTPDVKENVPKSLPEHVEARVASVYLPQRRVSDFKMKGSFEGYFDEYTVDVISRETKWVQGYSYPAREGDLGNVPANLVYNRKPSPAAEEVQQEKHGTALMQLLAQQLTRLKETGTLKEPFIGTFPLGPTIVPAFLYGVRPDGRLAWHRHDGARLDPRIGQPGAWKVASPSGSGWDGFRQVLPGGRNVIYAITRDGKLLWYRHNGFNTGAGTEWEGGKEIAGGGWADFTRVFSGGEGVIYAVTRAGKLLWYRHNGYGDGTRVWEPGKEVGSGWGGFKHVFSGGEGIVYAVTAEGKLLWYKHTGYANGAKAWEGPKEVGGGGWADHTSVFSAGDGIIYAVTRTGKLVWYRHTGYASGARAWEPGREVAAGWGDFTKTLALLPGVPDVVR